ncbi:Flagellar protein [Candidatus Methylobacter favarea]|uniref:Flagellar protein n=1 Tax=Candidatus Methylobacter favarea TaxID=2707345 RepID=A0A8S0X8C6_9GAMM|nr:flagellar biosynthetic protein FliO [Candidatus Methylobacter favarea]CAA9890990.1 Flagellar protein [Candidatus Methylobacter favarea]
MAAKANFYWLLFGWFPACWAAPGVAVAKPSARAVSSSDLISWSMGLLIVLSIFFLCIWGLRKLAVLTVNGAEKLRIVGGLSLGMREKVILLQAGKKQLILGVTPGRIQTLHILEGDDCLLRDDPLILARETGFAQKLRQALKGRSDA